MIEHCLETVNGGFKRVPKGVRNNLDSKESRYNGCAEGGGGVSLWSDSRRSCGHSVGRVHISAITMTLNMGTEALWCYGGHHFAAPEGFCGVGGRRALGGEFLA